MGKKGENYFLLPSQIEAIAKKLSYLPEKIHRTVKENGITPTADCVCTHKFDGVSKFLLVKRRERPWKGEWFIPGGQIRPLQLPLDACRTTMKREIGFVPRHIISAGCLHVFNPDSEYGPQPWFSLWHLHQALLSKKEVAQIKLDATGEMFAWFDRIDPNFPDPVKEALRTLGFRRFID